MLEEQETEAQRVLLEIETRGCAVRTEAEDEATALRHLGQAHRDNRAAVRYELVRWRAKVGEGRPDSAGSFGRGRWCPGGGMESARSWSSVRAGRWPRLRRIAGAPILTGVQG